jgi:hypothetical protein
MRAAVPVADEPVAAWLDSPATGLERRQRDALVLGWKVVRVGSRAAKWIHVGRVAPGLRRVTRALSPGGHLVAELLTWEVHRR